jgi:predicted DCC family thiol-disulfide oxidoreductase YuxK
VCLPGRVRPDPPLFVYDGACGFCRRWAAWLARRLPVGTTLVASQEIDDLARYGLSPDAVRAASYWIDARGTPHRGAASFAHALRHARAPWRAVGWVLRAPLVRTLADRAYVIVVRNRHRLPAPGDR